MSLIVVNPDSVFQRAFLRMLDDYEAHDPENGGSYALGRTDFVRYLRSLEDGEAGFNLLPGTVPQSTRWLIDSVGNVVAIVRVRHNINHPFLESVGGHIGYDVPPSHRGKRYSIEALNAGMEVARQIGLTKVLVCADADNIPSCRSIERSGGILEKEFLSEHWPIPVRRYWIDLSSDSGV